MYISFKGVGEGIEPLEKCRHDQRSFDIKEGLEEDLEYS